MHIDYIYAHWLDWWHCLPLIHTHGCFDRLVYAVADASVADTTQTVIQYVNGRWRHQLNVIVLTMWSIQSIETDLVSGACSVPTSTSLSHPTTLLVHLFKKKKKKSLRMVLHAWYFTERNRFCFRYRVLVCTVCWEEPSCFGIRRKLWLLTWRWHPNSLLTSILNISPVHSKYWPSPICVYVRARVCVRERVCSIAVFPCVTARTWVFISVVVFAVSFVFVGLEHFLSIIAHMPCHLWYVRVQWLCGCCYWVFWVSRWILDGEGWWVLNGIAAANVIKTLLWLCLRGEDKTSPSSSGFYHTLSVSRFLAPGL